MSNSVDHPDHYNQGGYECIEVMLSIYGPEVVKNFCIGNAFKYLFRCQHKNNKNEDIKKAAWYLNKYDEIDTRFSKSDSESTSGTSKFLKGNGSWDDVDIPSITIPGLPKYTNTIVATPEERKNIATLHS